MRKFDLSSSLEYELSLVDNIQDKNGGGSFNGYIQERIL